QRVTALTPVEVAELLRITRNTVYELIKRGELRGYRVGKKVRVDLEEVEAYKLRDGARGQRTGGVRAGGEASAAPRDSLVIAGQDVMLDVLVQQAEKAWPGFPLLRSHLGSYNGLYALYQGRVDMDTAHLWDAETGLYNAPFVKRMLPGVPAVLVHLAERAVGFYVRAGNPLGIAGWNDLARAEVTMVNRELGSGMRVLIDQELRLLGLDPRRVKGYDNVAASHIAVASAVSRGDADIGVGNRQACAQVRGVELIFLRDESLDLVVPALRMQEPWIRRVLAVLRSTEYRSEIESLGGYGLADLGRETEAR
ncbi:MAG TPA: helix-turn-helix transcriptional regulator, partial [Spirochaetia bacterium]